ncbi:MAE_28990/MAE_18760 family HEPN-like nuclease [Serratia rubidaea]|uniref:MAE_28990/MAE_18760 family HEPN-like nuclease n=1 Tax=Serratia rubidaea TaxID=61652 RepID=UPI0023499083|nr:MAE_28990/MAE_18760 family HEPN-like nuclease [Serratia rubidaea]MDC6108689.1 MAE_28990/MAE_18760 family HEPN-like nuclease [Serratia rubidaea]
MSPEDFLTQVELERSWREEEIRSLNNIMERSDDNNAYMMRRAVVCLLYAHIEGFVKFSFNLYIDGINKMELKCSQVKPILAAAVHYSDLLKMNNPDIKNRIFKKVLPDDSHLHRICRYEEFFEKISNVMDETIFIEDGYVNTESNVGKEVLQKLLYQVGLSHTSLNNVIGPLTRLKNKRNDISHGVNKAKIEYDEYKVYYDCSINIMGELIKVLFSAYQKKDFMLVKQ